jgi:hypothetical protein
MENRLNEPLNCSNKSDSENVSTTGRLNSPAARSNE